jgi:hypothetical protein
VTLPVNDIAQVCHEANRALQAVQADPGNPVSLPWDEIGHEMRVSATTGVVTAMSGATPEQLHQSWCDFKIANGWFYGPVKDEVMKTHPCLVPYEDLPPGQQIKDHLFSAIVKALS